MFEVVNERRKYQRFNHHVAVQYKDLNVNEDTQIGALTRDVSEGGIRFIGNEFLSLAKRLVMTISLPAPSRPIKIISKVAWIRKVPMGDQYEIGSQFLSMSEGDKRELRDYLNKAEETEAI